MPSEDGSVLVPMDCLNYSTQGNAKQQSHQLQKVEPSADECVKKQEEPTTIYSVHSPARRRGMLFAVSVGSIMVPFTDTIYLPALPIIGKELSAPADLVTASVSIYMLTVGVGSLIWGPLADWCGRRATYAASSVLFLGTTVGCIFAPTADALVIIRAFQGLAVAAYLTTGQAVVADVYEPAGRGTAMGLFMLPLLVGPLLGPLLGGVLSQFWGWRSTFICLVVLGGGVVVPLLVLLLPETQQPRVARMLAERDPQALKGMAGADELLSAQLKLAAPWVPLGYLLEWAVLPYVLLNMSTFGALFTSMTVWPSQVAAPPYNLSEAMIGVSFLVMGFGGLLGSPLGGKAADMIAARWPGAPAARMAIGAAVAALVMPIGLLLMGWSLAVRTHIIAPLAGHFLIGAACAIYLSGLLSYISTIKQANAGAAGAAVQAIMFSAAAVLISANVPGVQMLGVGGFFSVLAGVQFALAAVTCASVIAAMARWK